MHAQAIDAHILPDRTRQALADAVAQVNQLVLGKPREVRLAFTTLLAFALITFVGAIPALGGTTALLLLCVFVVVNLAVLVLRSDRVAHQHFRTPTVLPILGALSCAFLAGPWTGRDLVQYRIAGILMAIGVGLWLAMRLMEPAAARD